MDDNDQKPSAEESEPNKMDSNEETNINDAPVDHDQTAVAEGGGEVEVEAEVEAASAEAEDAAEETPEPVTPEETEAPAETPVAAAEDHKPRFKRGEVIEGTIVKTAPTEIDIHLGDGVVGVVPGRELERMSRNNIEELQAGETVMVYVVNPNDHRGKVILSINRAMEEMDWQRAEEYRAEQHIYEDTVAGYNRGGLIVRFGRLRGFVPQSQISDERRRLMKGETPEERYGGMVNDDIFVKVMEVDRSRNRLILSERAASRERREARKASLVEELSVGQVLEGRVVSLEEFGAFVDVGGAEGLVHLTEISWKHVTHPREALKVGETVKVEVISIDPRRKRIGLSIKRQQPDPWDEVATTYQVGDLVKANVTKLTKFGAFARLVDAEDIEGLIHISELSEERVSHPREVVNEGEELTLRVVKIDVKNRRLGLSLKRVNSAEYLDYDLGTFSDDTDV